MYRPQSLFFDYVINNSNFEFNYYYLLSTIKIGNILGSFQG